MIKVFIDGSQGTTGLRLKDRLMERKDIELLTISEEERKSLPARAQKVAEADVAFLCLPDAASRELVETVKDPKWQPHQRSRLSRQRVHCRYRAAGPDGPCLP